MIHQLILTASLFLGFIFFTGFCFFQTAWAKPEKEIEFLSLYFTEEQLVETATRHPKSLSQVAENVTIITAKEIEMMNAHTTAEVLNRVTGVFVDFTGRDFGSLAPLRIQGSNETHVLVLLDSVSWNFLAGGNAETNMIPVETIARIEVIKGPASSTWGSSLGGVINIITKKTGATTRPTGLLSTSYGESNTLDSRTQLSGKAGRMGYYLYAGHQESDGLFKSRGFDNDSLYAKLGFNGSNDVNLGFTLGYSDQDANLGELPVSGLLSRNVDRTFFATATLDAAITKGLSGTLSLHTYNHKFVQLNDESGLWGPMGDLFQNSIFDEEKISGSGRLAWLCDRHTVVSGFDVGRGELEQTIEAGDYRQAQGAAPITTTAPDIDTWAFYVNDTMVFKKWSITPGLRYDDNSITSSFVSPSLGITYEPTNHTLLRGSVSRGFTSPPLAELSGGGLFLDPNPELEPEEVWSYQLGLESTAARHVWLKATLFLHNLEETLDRTQPSPVTSGNTITVNNGKERRQGGEIEAETISFHNFSLTAGGIYVHIETFAAAKNQELYSANLGLRYDDQESLRAELFGHYVWWGLSESSTKGVFDDFIWDLNISKRVFINKTTDAELFFTSHNLFNGAQFSDSQHEAPDRWVEGGVRFHF